MDEKNVVKDETLDKLRAENERLRARLEALEMTERERDICLEKLVRDKMQSDLDELKKAEPSLEALDSLGEEFIRLVENGIDAKTAYHAIKQAVAAPAVPSTGEMGTAGNSMPEFYSSRELDRLTARDLEDPAVFKKAMKSLKRL